MKKQSEVLKLTQPRKVTSQPAKVTIHQLPTGVFNRD